MSYTFLDQQRYRTSAAPLPPWRLCRLIAALLAVLLLAPVAHSQKEPPFELPTRPEILKIRSAILETSQGTIYIELFPEEAPWHVANFKYLADRDFYRGRRFHLYHPKQIIQGGDPRGDGFGGPGYTLPPEFSKRHHSFGSLGMARVPNSDSQGRPANPERRSNGSQFYFILGDDDPLRMDRDHTIFGRVVGGLDVLERLRPGDSIEKLTVFIREGGR